VVVVDARLADAVDAEPAAGIPEHDEPTTGLHFSDIEKLLHGLERLVDTGNTVLVVEQNLEVIAAADWVIDMGPEAGGGVMASCHCPEPFPQLRIFNPHSQRTPRRIAPSPCLARLRPPQPPQPA